MGALPANLSIGSMFRFWLFSAWPSFPWASLNLKQRQLPIQRLTRIFCMESTMDLDLDIMGATMDTLTTTERDLLRLSLFLLLMLMPRLKQTPGTDTMDMVLVTMVLGTMATMAIPTCMARDPPMPRLDLLPKLRLMPKLTRIFFMATMDLDIIMGAIMVTATHTTAATTMASKKGRDPIES